MAQPCDTTCDIQKLLLEQQIPFCSDIKWKIVGMQEWEPTLSENMCTKKGSMSAKYWRVYAPSVPLTVIPVLSRIAWYYHGNNITLAFGTYTQTGKGTNMYVKNSALFYLQLMIHYLFLLCILLTFQISLPHILQASYSMINGGRMCET